jgi:ABC-type bacteriocin/lantibiotic exporter with double-glycine peptidase domain
LPSELRWLAEQIRPFVRWHLASFACFATASLLSLLPPLVLKWLLDQILPHRAMGSILFAVGMILLACQGRTVVTSLGSYLMLSSAQQLSLALRVSVLRHLDTLSADYYERVPVGAAIYPLKEPIEEISFFGSDLLPTSLRMVLAACLTLATMFLLSPALTLSVAPLVPLFLVSRHYFRRKLTLEADSVQHRQLAWTNFLQEHVSAITSVQLLGQESRQERRAFRLLAHTVRSQQKLFITGIWFTISTSLAIVIALSAVIGYGARSVLAGSLSIGSLVAFYALVTQLFEPLSGAAELYSKAQRTFASVRQVQATFAVHPAVAESSVSVALTHSTAAEIDFAGVEFGYQRQKDMLSIPSLRISPGEQVAIVGENGAGKSTLAKLITRVYDVDSGSIHIGGQDLRNICLGSLRREICYLPRDPVLFDGNLASNLRFVRPTASEDELCEAIRNTGLSALVTTLPGGLGERLGPGACQLSGGQRQRLALARALLQRPRILVMDEATSCPTCATAFLQRP